MIHQTFLLMKSGSTPQYVCRNRVEREQIIKKIKNLHLQRKQFNVMLKMVVRMVTPGKQISDYEEHSEKGSKLQAQLVKRSVRWVKTSLYKQGPYHIGLLIYNTLHLCLSASALVHPVLLLLGFSKSLLCTWEFMPLCCLVVQCTCDYEGRQCSRLKRN